ncbi:MAG: glycoside hydrolase family 43 protein [bacterium]|nr:glycoside hydrolase family 43 protein [bacterium]
MHSDNSYTNPVFQRSFPDPFVLKFGGAFYGYSTGFSSDGQLVFPVISSNDLINWENAGAAMEPIPSAPPLYWAPEVTYANGRFYLYYSCGNEIHMELRVAVSDRPDAGFVDSGVRLTNEQFAIDAHVFSDDDGEKYLFYATDFLEHSHIGTGTVVDRMLDWFHLEGNPRPVTRARYDWQVYDPRRAEKGNVRWHTIEGPTVLKRKGKYFQMFSGGNWKNESYGVGYAVSESLLNSEEWKQSIDGTTILPMLRSVDEVLGPGHNSVVLGPNNRELFCVYHSWVNDERVMSVDRMDVVDERMILLGPTISAQPLPFAPQSAAGPDTRTFDKVSPDFLLEATTRLSTNCGHARFEIFDENGSSLAGVELSDGKGYFRSQADGQSSVLPQYALFDEYQCLWIEVNGRRLQLKLNGRVWHESSFDGEGGDIRIEVTRSAGTEILNLDLTEGFVDLFETDLDAEELGWVGLSDTTELSSDHQSLVIGNESGLSIAAKGRSFGDFEFAANLSVPASSGFGFVLLSDNDQIEMLIDLSNVETVPLGIDPAIPTERVRVPVAVPPRGYRQYRFVKQNGNLSLDVEGCDLARYKVSSAPSRIGIVTSDRVSVEMVRVTKIGS